MRILIVDDNPTNVIIIREILKKENYQNTLSASSALEMLEHLGIGDRDQELHPGDRTSI